MKQIIGNKKYDTDTAVLVTVWKNRWLLKYEQETGEEFDLPKGKIIEEDPSCCCPDCPCHKEEEPDFDWTDKGDPDDPEQEEDKGGTDLEEEDDDDFVFLSGDVAVPLADDFDFDSDEPEQKDDEESEEDDPEEDENQEDEPENPDEDAVVIKLAPMWEAELLFRKDNGKYFIWGIGGGASNYWDKQDNGEFIPLDSEVEAYQWALDRKLPVEVIEEIFGKIYE